MRFLTAWRSEGIDAAYWEDWRIQKTRWSSICHPSRWTIWSAV
ncbi:hypothetical protein ACQ86N_14550 [Puia sp. P3]